MNTFKRKSRKNSAQTSSLGQMKLNGNIIEYVDEYVYLGQFISTLDQTNKEI